MKKLTALLLILILTALCAPALATNTDGLGDTVARSAELAAFLDGSGNIYVSGLEKPVNTTKAESLVSIDPYRIIFFAQQNPGRLISLKMDGFAESIVTDDAYAACLDEENVYYISRSDRTHLVRSNLDSGTNVVVFTGNEALDRIYDSSIGVIVTLIDGAGAYITDPISGQFIPYVGDAARQVAAGDGFEVYLTDANNLYARPDGALAPTQVDANVRAWAIVGHNVYYLCGLDGALTLKQYNVDVNLWDTVLALPADIEPQLTASQNSLFVISSSHAVYSVDIGGKRLVNYAMLPSPQSYALGGTRRITDYRIEAVSGQLNVYGIVEDSSVQPTFTFVDFSAPALEEESDIMLLSAYNIDAESTVWNLLQPAPQYSTLRRGSRGEAVSLIQQPLYDAGYYNYYIDGIFGWRTERAVELLQDALGLRVNGIADADLQKRILSGNFPDYDPYGRLRLGNSGLRVREMQQRLRDLGYLADDADSYFGERTLAAVELFQRENGLTVDGIAGGETLRKLFSSSARVCSSYIELRRGDTGYRVRELNRRLKELYYLEDDAGSTFTAATAEALRRFQEEIGVRQTGIATESVQRELFSRSAPEYSGYITLRRGDDNDRVLEMQRRLKQLGYYDNGLDGYFGKGTYQAVRAFQRQAGLKVTGVADPKTLARLFASDAPAYQPPVSLTTPEIDFYGDSFEQDKSGVYQVPEATRKLTFFWTAKGVANYDITLSGDGETITSMRGTTDEMASVSTTRLLNDVVYQFTVVAHPEDTAHNKDAKASLKFKIVTEPSVVESVTIRPVKDTYTREDGVYLIPGNTIAFRWTAYGDVGRYSYAVYGDDPQTPIDQGQSADRTEWSIASAELDPEVTYSLTVFAYPKNGSDDDAVSDTVYFRPAVEPLPTVEPTPEPTVEPTPEPTEATAEEVPQNGEQPSGEDVSPESEQPGTEEQPSAEDVPQDGEQPSGEETPQDGEDAGADASTVEIAAPAMQANPVIGEATMEVAHPDGSATTENVALIDEGVVELSWAAEGDVAGYQVTITDSTGNVMVDERMANPSAHINSQNLILDSVYALTATAYFNDGQSSVSTLYFMRPSQAAGEQPGADEAGEESIEQAPYDAQETATEEPYVEEPYVEEPYVEEPYVEEPYVEEPYIEEPYIEEPTEEPYVEEPTEEPAPLGVPSVQVYPNAGEAQMDVAHPDGSVTSEYVVFVQEGSLDLSWAAEGDVAGYQVTITDSNGNVMVDQRMTNTGATINSQNLTPGAIYQMIATAYSNSGEQSTASLYFTLPAPAEEAYEDESYGEDADQEDYGYEDTRYEEEPYVEEPYVEEPYIEEPYVEEPYVEEPYEEEPYVEEPYVEEPYEEEPYVEEPYEEEPYVEEPSVEEPAYEETAGGVDTSQPIDEFSGAGVISALQERLCEGGWLMEGDYEDGVLDEATIQAVLAFQTHCIESGSDLTPIDPTAPVISPATLRLLYAG